MARRHARDVPEAGSLILQGDIWVAHFGPPRGSAAAYRRPVVIVQNDRLNRSALGTIVVVPLTTNVRWARVNGNVLLHARERLAHDSVANVSQMTAVDRAMMLDEL